MTTKRRLQQQLSATSCPRIQTVQRSAISECGTVRYELVLSLEVEEEEDDDDDDEEEDFA